MAKLLKNAETARLGKAETKGLKSADTKKLTKSPARAKKEKAKYQVKDAENALLLKLKNGDVVIEMFPTMRRTMWRGSRNWCARDFTTG